MQNQSITTTRKIAGLLGPSLVAITVSEMVNIHIWAGNTAAGVYFNGAVLFVTGLAIIRAHNLWVRGWPVLVTLAGWALMLLGLFRMFFPEQQLAAARHASLTIVEIVPVMLFGIFLSCKAYERKDSDKTD